MEGDGARWRFQTRVSRRNHTTRVSRFGRDTKYSVDNFTSERNNLNKSKSNEIYSQTDHNFYVYDTTPAKMKVGAIG